MLTVDHRVPERNNKTNPVLYEENISCSLQNLSHRNSYYVDSTPLVDWTL